MSGRLALQLANLLRQVDLWVTGHAEQVREAFCHISRLNLKIGSFDLTSIRMTARFEVPPA